MSNLEENHKHDWHLAKFVDDFPKTVYDSATKDFEPHGYFMCICGNVRKVLVTKVIIKNRIDKQ